MILYITLYLLSHTFDLYRHNIARKQVSLYYEGGYEKTNVFIRNEKLTGCVKSYYIIAFDNQTTKVTYTLRQATDKRLHSDLSCCRGVEVLKSGSVSGTACFLDAKSKTKSENICLFIRVVILCRTNSEHIFWLINTSQFSGYHSSLREKLKMR